MVPENPQEIIENIGARIAELREASKLTQAQVAERLDMTVSNYQRIEHGLLNVTVKTLVRVANAIEVSSAELFSAPVPRQRKRGRPSKPR